MGTCRRPFNNPMKESTLAILLLSLGVAPSDLVSCGGHKAPTCALCPLGNGAWWCNGDCVWINGQCEGDKLTPVAAFLSTTQYIFAASVCIDGVTGGFHKLCHSKYENAPWLAVDYGTKVVVERVLLFNRWDCCYKRTKNVHIRISNELPTNGRWMFPGGEALGTFKGPATKGQINVIHSGPGWEKKPGRYLIIQMKATYINLIEVRAVAIYLTEACFWALGERDTDGYYLKGIVSSPNFPNYYPNRLQITETIKVDEGLVISLQFTYFDIEYHFNCKYDHLTILDGDGSTLMEKSCGRDNMNVVVGGERMDCNRPPVIKSNSNVVNLLFHTGGVNSRNTGWSASWSAGFRCPDPEGTTLPFDQVCDGIQQCPQTSKSSGGEDEDNCSGSGDGTEVDWTEQ